jgi:hypothetical protein
MLDKVSKFVNEYKDIIIAIAATLVLIGLAAVIF